MKRIILTGGGTAGHVTPNIALLQGLREKNFEIHYIGSQNGIEKELLAQCDVPYYGISSGKLRRYLSVKNMTDIFRVVKGLGDANKLIKKIKPDILFSKGGFVSVPVVIACKLNKIPVIIHESDMTPGLANKISIPFADKVCATFPETLKHLPAKKAVLTGSPIRSMLFDGSKIEGRNICGFESAKPVILVMGGSLGAVAINNCIRNVLPELLLSYNVVHICGKNNADTSIKHDGYKQFEYISAELAHIFALSDIIISRAGSNSINEFLALKKPSLLIPLPKSVSRGDQILNAQSFEKQGFSKMLGEEEMTEQSLVKEINDLFENRGKYISAMEKSGLNDGVNEVMKLICETVIN